VRLKWFKDLKPVTKVLVLCGAVLVALPFYISLSRYIKSALVLLLSPPLTLSEGVSSNARQFLRYQNLLAENKQLNTEIGKLTAQLVELEDVRLENQRLRTLLSLPQSKALHTETALLIGKDSSNWTKTIMVNKGTSNGIREGMAVVSAAGLVGKITEASARASKAALIIDFNSKIPAKVLRSREEGVVFGTLQAGRGICKMKYIQGDVTPGDKIISSGLGGIYPRGLLIGEVIAVEEEENKLYRIAEIEPAVNLSTLEEVMVVIKE
jgi:rod shape-determining protein MreC